MIVTAITTRGLTINDLKLYTIGGIVDYITTWNNIMGSNEQGDNVREATNEDIRAFKSR